MQDLNEVVFETLTSQVLYATQLQCSAILSRHLKRAVDLNKKELDKKTANVELWGMQKFLRSTADEMNKMMKRSVQTGSSPCPQSPSEVQVALMPCLRSYLEVMPTVDMENIMNDPEVQRTYCEYVKLQSFLLLNMMIKTSTFI